MMIDNSFLEQLKNKNKKIISRSISIVESENSKSVELLNSIYKETGKAYRIGITGPPGAGKSSITNQLIKHYRKLNKTVGVIAIDPTSPFSGGALLGDRVRMSDAGKDEGVFIRSMATRGSLGGLSKKAIDAADVLDAAGYNYIIFETVGVGQSELDIAQAADSTIVVLVPESGDAIQAMKAGLMEIADFFVMNKCDRPGFESAISGLKTILMFREHTIDSWLPDIIQAVATENKGIENIAAEIRKHHDFLLNSNTFLERRKQKTKIRIEEIIKENFSQEIINLLLNDKFSNSLEDVMKGNVSPYQLASKIIESYKKQFG